MVINLAVERETPMVVDICVLVIRVYSNRKHWQWTAFNYIISQLATLGQGRS